MISDVRVQELESNLTMYATKWDDKIQTPKLELKGMNEKVRSVKHKVVKDMSQHMH